MFRLYKYNRPQYKRFKYVCSSDYKLRESDLHNAINKEITCPEDAINKGFALLAVDNKLCGFQALECFFEASVLDYDNKYNKVISCGTAQARCDIPQCQCIIH